MLANLAFVACLKCGQGRGKVAPPTVKLDRPMVGGIYQLASYPGCSTPYVDDDAHTTVVYVVGFGTEHERLFRSAHKSAMITYYNSFNGGISLWHDYADRFCAQAMRDLLHS